MASAFLESVGINALILADDCGGLLQPLAVSKGFRVMVSDEDLSRAEASLKDYEARTHTPVAPRGPLADGTEDEARGE